MDQQSFNRHLSQANELFSLLDWWYPQRLTEQTGIKTDRIKYLARLRKEFNSAKGPAAGELTAQQIDVLDHFAQSLSFSESKALESLLPKDIDGRDFDFVDLFAGIGGIRKPFSEIGGRCVLTCELDEYAKKTYLANWKNHREHKFVSDIKSITQPKTSADLFDSGKSQTDYIDKEMPRHDVLLAGFPCQPFSIAGVSKKNALQRAHGFECEDQGQLFFDICRILLVKQPPIVVLENVKNLKSHNKGHTFSIIKQMLTNLPSHQNTLFGEQVFETEEKNGYWIANLNDTKPDPKVIDGKHFVPQHRERIVLLCIREDIVEKLNLDKKINLKDIEIPDKPSTLKDILFQNKYVPDKYTLTSRLWEYLVNYSIKHKAKGNGFGYGMVKRNTTDVTRTLSARYYKDGSEILINQDDMRNHKEKCGRPRRMTPHECANLMGFTTRDEHFHIPVSDTRAYKQFGNSVVVPVFRSIAELLAPHLDEVKSTIR